MLLKYVFLVVLVMPNGETDVRAADVAQCPDIRQVYQSYESAKDNGDIQHWDAQCLLFQFKLPEEQT